MSPSEDTHKELDFKKQSWSEWREQLLEEVHTGEPRVQKVEVDLDLSSNDALETMGAKIAATLKKRRDAAEIDSIKLELEHVRGQLDLNGVNELSLDHLEIYKSYLGRVASDDAEIVAEVTELGTAIDKLAASHPLRLIPKSGDNTENIEGVGGAAILNVPMTRRIQTICVVFLCFLSLLMIVFSTLAAFLFFLPLTFLTLGVVYYSFVYYDTVIKPRPWVGEGSRYKPWYRYSAMFRHFVDYFPVRVVVEDSKKFDAEKNYLMCVHPHGVQCAGAFGMMSHPSTQKLLPGLSLTAQTLPVWFYVPFLREHIIAAGVGNASRESITKMLTWAKGASTILVVGGAKEALYCAPHSNKIALKDRMGFVKLAIQTGANIVPVYAYGENSLYDNFSEDRPRFIEFQRKIQKFFTVAPMVVAGRGVFNYSGGLLPKRRPVTPVIGNPLVVEKNENPSRELVESVHARYIEELRALFNRYRNIYDPRCEDMQII